MLSNEKWFGASAPFYSETIDQSYRIESSNLSRTPSSDGNRRTFSISVWVKRSALGGIDLFSTGSNSYNQLSWTFRFTSDDALYVYASLAGISNDVVIASKAKFRDTSNWYHFMCAYDSTQATASNRVKLYANGSQLEIDTSFGNHSYGNQNYDTSVNDATYVQRVGRFASVVANQFSGYMAEFNLIDGTALDPTSFGETKNGVWIPKEISGLTYGTNGFRLTFADSSSLGDDTSGNGNDYTTNGAGSTDVVADSPTNNFCTYSNLYSWALTNTTLSEGNLKSTETGTTFGVKGIGTIAVNSGKWYFETHPHLMGNAFHANIGVIDVSEMTTTDGTGSDTGKFKAICYASYQGRKSAYGTGVDSNITLDGLGQSAYGDSWGATDIIGVALDIDNDAIYFSKNGTWQNSATSAEISAGTTTNSAYTGKLSGLTWTVAQGNGLNANNFGFTLNAGQDPSFAGYLTGSDIGTETPSEGAGVFKYAPPTGFLALCSANLSDTTISPNKSTQADDHFNTVLYTGNGTSQSITGVGFQPDWVWAKTRNDGSLWHFLLDSSRGGNARLYSNGTGAESTSVNNITSFDSDGFSVGSAVNLNKSSEPIVAWNWKAGGSAPTKTYKVVVVSDSGNKYRFRNSADSATFAQSAVTLDLQEGGTYTFDLSDSSMSGHPLRFSTTSDGTHGGGSEYTTGVTTNGTAGSSGATVTITVASSAPTLYYYCSNHSGMGGQIDTNTTFGQTNFDGSILSVEQASTDAGFSIVLYASGSSGDKTIGHGLSSKPEFIISKSRDASSSYSWVVYHEDVASTVNKYLALNATDALSDNGTGIWGSAFPTSTVFGITSGNGVNANTNCIAYCFHSVEGYSKFGTYTGNSSADGTFIYTGFRPAWIMVKKTTGADDWIIHDNARSPFNVVNGLLEANTSDAEFSDDSCDFLSNGFKWRLNSGARNTSGQTYLYMAFSDGQTAKFSNAR